MKARRRHERAAAYHDQEVRLHPRLKHILWVEGDEDNREMITHFLGQSGHRVTSAGTTVEALAVARGEHFDLYLLGDWPPYGKESKFCGRIRESDPRSPILFFSSAAYQADRHRGMEAGAQGYLTKPGGLDDLEPTISRLLDQAGDADRAEALI